MKTLIRTTLAAIAAALALAAASCTTIPPVTGTITTKDGQITIEPGGRITITIEPAGGASK